MTTIKANKIGQVVTDQATGYYFSGLDAAQSARLAAALRSDPAATAVITDASRDETSRLAKLGELARRAGIGLGHFGRDVLVDVTAAYLSGRLPLG